MNAVNQSALDAARAESAKARERNRRTIRITAAENGYIVTDGTGADCVYHTLDESYNLPEQPETVVDHIHMFFKGTAQAAPSDGVNQPA